MRINKDHPKFKQLAAEANWPIPRMALSMKEAGESLGQSWQVIYREIRKGKIIPVRTARKFLIPVSELERYLRENADRTTYPRVTLPGKGPRVGSSRRKKPAAPVEAKEVVTS